jgi:hypothetical protein
MQARHACWPDELTWARFYSSESLGHFLQQARNTPLQAWLGSIDTRQTVHEMERALRGIARGYAEEVASWVPEDWQRAVRWTAMWMDLPFVRALGEAGKPPSWLRADPRFGSFAFDRQAERVAALRQSQFAPLLEPIERPLIIRWVDHFRALCPPASGSQMAALRSVQELVGAHQNAMAQTDAATDGWALRKELMREIQRCFRSFCETPAAVFCHLVWVGLQLERLRGAVVRRALLPEVRSKVAWV